MELRSLTEVQQALIRGRIAAGLNQRQLAERLGLREQQVQRYEATGYAGVSLQRAQDVANALGLRLQERVVLPQAARANALRWMSGSHGRQGLTHARGAKSSPWRGAHRRVGVL